MGNGRFADKLSFDDWLAFNNAQRAHYNFIEGLPTILVLLLVSGLFCTKCTVLLGAVYFVGRALFGLGYRSRGPTGRFLGTVLLDLALVALLLTSVWGAWNFAGGLSGLKGLCTF